jgi:hypothetical protein
LVRRTARRRRDLAQHWRHGARSRRKRKEDGGVLPMGLLVLKRTTLMFPRDPIEDA